jgi:hypothetical protein
VSFRFDRDDLRLRFVDPIGQPQARGELPQTARVNYLRGADSSRWLTGLPTYGQLTYEDVWPGIDLRFKGAAGTFKYELVVHPGARANDIAFAHDGARSLKLDADGNLLIETGSRSLTDTRPVAFLEGTPQTSVDARFVVGSHNTYRFDVAPYDSTRTLVIDPGIVYATYLGTPRDDAAFAIAADWSGNTYVAGYAPSGFPTTSGAYDTSMNGEVDAYVAKLDDEGTHLIYSTYIGGSSFDNANYIAVDSTGAVYVTGTTTSADFPTTPGAFQRTHREDSELAFDLFVTKLDTDGASLVYSTFLGGGQSDAPGGIALDVGGGAYLTGRTNSPDFPVTPGAYDTTPPNGSSKAFVTRLNASGTGLIFSTFLGNASQGTGVALDESGRPFVAGRTTSPTFPTTIGAFQRTFGGQSDAYLAELNPLGTALLYSTYFGGAKTDYAAGVGVSQGFVYLALNTNSTDLQTTDDAVRPTFQSAQPDDYDGFVVAFQQDWSLKFATYLGGDGSDVIEGVSGGQIGFTVTGTTTSTNFPTTPGGVGQTLKGPLDAFVSGFAFSGTPYYSTYVGGSGSDGGGAIAQNARGNLYIAGRTSSTDFPTFTGAFQRQSAGAQDGFVARIIPTASISVNKPATASSSENASLGPQNVTDGNARTRWSSAFSDEQWIQVDLGAQASINRVVVHWEEAYAFHYQVQLSPNLVDWYTVATVINGNGGVDEFEGEGVFNDNLPPVRYVRLNLQQRGTQWGYSLWEFDVYGAILLNQPPVVTLTSPSDLARYSPPALIPLRADASDPDGTIANVLFYANETFLASDDTAPYTFDWADVPPGTYRIYAAAADNRGSLVRSKSATVTVTSGTPQPGDNLALNRPAFASSVESSAFLPGYAFDGSITTRWSSQFLDDQSVSVDLGQPFQIRSVVLRWEAAYATRYEIRVSNDGATWSTVYVNSAGHGGTETIALNNPARYVMMRGLQRATPWGFSLWEFEVYGDTLPVPGDNLALGKPATASSVENAAFAPSNAFDGQKSTRWSSAFANNQWITVDLGNIYHVTRVVLNWETAYAATYALQISNDGKTWNTFRNVSKSSSGTDDLGVTATGRYVRMFAFDRGTPWGVSLWEFEVYGIPVSLGPNLALTGTATASSIENSNFTPDKAIDGNLQTRWSSAFADGQSIVIDLGSVFSVRRVVLRWEAAYARSYLLQYSSNPAAEGYFTVGLQSDGHGGVEDWAWNTDANARYIRVFCSTRATPYGCSLFEVEVYATR